MFTTIATVFTSNKRLDKSKFRLDLPKSIHFSQQFTQNFVFDIFPEVPDNDKIGQFADFIVRICID